MRIHKYIFLIMSLIIPHVVWALPADWTGVFGVDSLLINNYRRTEDITTNGADDSQVITGAPGAHLNARSQSYKFKLAPSLIINDSATFTGEITTGYGYGGRLGDASTTDKSKSWGNALYHHNNPSGSNNLTLSKFYVELFADAATIVLGRQPFNWGLGAIYNSGDHVWDRHSTTKDGLQFKLKFGNFNLYPYYFKSNPNGGLTRASNAREMGVSLLYDNTERDLTFGLLIGKKSNRQENEELKSNFTGLKMGTASLKITDIYLKKSFGDFTFAVEVPFFSGSAGHVYNTTDLAKFKGMAVIAQSTFHVSDSFLIGLDGGVVSGDDGQSPSFDAMFLHPNYQIANLMFRYNLAAVGDQSQSLYDSYITNTKFIKFHFKYESDIWRWTSGIIYAIANETASANAQAYNHTTNKVFSSQYAQESDLGFEIDTGLDYKWNENITVGGSFGYHIVGAYYEFNNTQITQTLKNSYTILLKTAVSF